ncbi:MAG: sensor domain-containing diguanylate cyclase [Chloroflexi bacterium]|nr:MAG: sensor domain-containing diguanylate cyclase [Chloroflexota bacterium]
MSSRAARVKRSDLVPLADRMRYMQIVRALIAALVIIFGWLGWTRSAVDMVAVGEVTVGYIAVSLTSWWFWRLLRRRSLPLFGAMLIIDGVYLAWVTYATGGTSSPLRFLTLLHLITVALLASYRTGVKLAFWHSLLLFVVHYAEEANILRPVDIGVAGHGDDATQLFAFVAVFWLVALATSSLSALNERELRRSRLDVEALARLATELETAGGPHECANVLLTNLAEAFGFERLVLIGGSGQQAIIAHRGSVHVVSPAATTEDSLIEHVRRTRQTALVSHLDPTSDTWLESVFSPARNLVVVPLSAEGSCLGVLVIEHAMANGSRIERRVVSALERFASYAALALRNAWLVEQLQEQATTDGLTGIANHRTFEARLENELTRASRNQDALSLLMIDLDHFKQVNETFGHPAGDALLRQIGGVLVDHCRQFDTAARYGGEEFALILPSCDERAALIVAERLRQAVSTLVTTTPVTASIGVATHPVHGSDANSLVKAADDALYRSKRGGRNRVTSASRKRRSNLIEPPRKAAG